MGIRSRLMTGLLAGTLSLSGGAVFAQESTPVATPAGGELEIALLNADGVAVGEAMITEDASGVTIQVQSTDDSMIAPGEHGIHIHEYGVCDPEVDPPFDSAGGHFNPTGASHGAPEDEDSHAGDLGNLTVEDDSSFDFEITTDKVTLDLEGESSLFNPSGTSLLIHENPDDLMTDPSGESGDRIACGIIAQPLVPSASPVNQDIESLEATPAS